MRKAILNIGLKAGQSVIDPRDALEAAAAFGITITNYGIEQSNFELTLIAEIEVGKAAVAQIALLSRALNQDCIAVWFLDTQRGSLIGPKASEWGPFNPEFFLMPDGTTLQAWFDDRLLANFFEGGAV